MRFSILSATLLLLSVPVLAQTDSSRLQLSAYVEPYYSFDFNQPENNTRPGFFYSYNRHGEVNLNLGALRAAYAAPRVRANASLAAGTYMNANYSAEPGVLRNVLEMNAGVKLSQKADLWVDAGVFPSHIGIESAIGRDCRNLTRSLVAENSPYFESGAKLTYNTPNGKWTLTGLVLNGWQRIQRPDGLSMPSFGTQIVFRPSDGVVLNSSSFLGTDKPDDVRLMRYYHNLYGIFQLGDKVELTLGLDTGWEQKRKGESDYNTWFTPVGIVRYAATDKLALAFRAEYYRDQYGVIIATGTPDGFNVSGFSLNLDYAVMPNALWRIEGRFLSSGEDKIFVRDGDLVKTNAFVTTSFAFSF